MLKRFARSLSSLSLSLSKFRVLFLLVALSAFHYSIFTSQAYANNIIVSNVSLYKAAGQPNGTIGVKFDVVWDNSFTSVDNNGQTFFDRAWVFVKYFDAANAGTDTAWSHATLISGGTVSSYNAQSGTGISADQKGAFCRPGTNQVVYWDYATDGVSPSASISVKVMAIEMVYVPTGSFYVGSGGTETNAFYSYPNTTSPYKISSEDSIIVGTATGNLYYPNSNTYGGDQAGPIPAAFPKGYNGFYMMKYEVNQGQYRDFLNTLNRAQQNQRAGNGTTLASGTTSVTNIYVMANTSVAANIASASNYRSGIRCDAAIPATTPITFYCDYNNNGTPNESTDGEWIACNYVSWPDLCAYADWAGLRPFTELEFEKASIGLMNPIANEYAWGPTAPTAGPTGPTNPGANNETATNNANCSYNGTVSGPMRSGFAATSSSSRYASGGSYYGIMELSGNLWERPVTVGNSTGRLFIGSHGDGSLSTTNTDWPGTNATGSGYRGGGWSTGSSYARVSDRIYAAYTDAGRYYYVGIRCARTSP
ncbi:MAG: SUMF1/EgtB/PvdO family nonheme iron enzyme [Candidatus Omnitrophica bacterium]|nr:SUMF1/EgtB/PvdO family nonheme iron enzyme [Candidatus Omnitrophota bacterium]